MIRDVIRVELERRRWSIRELARRTDLFPHKLSVFLQGKSDIRCTTLEKVMHALDLEIRPKPKRRRR